MTRDEANAEIAELLMDNVRADRFPSVAHMNMLEDILPREMLPDYLDVLLDKLAQDTIPSIPMLRRVQAVAQRMPLVESSARWLTVFSAGSGVRLQLLGQSRDRTTYTVRLSSKKVR